MYGRLKSNHIPYWLLTPIRRFIRKTANRHLPFYFQRHGPLMHEKIEGLVVSFTSFPARIDKVWLVVESLKRQTVLPEKIILWLSRKQFPSQSDIPTNLQSLVDSLFEIRFVEEDIRSHKKYYYVLTEFKDKTFITCDDDVFYDPKMIQRLVDTSRHYPGCIIANHTSQILFDVNGDVLPYRQFSGFVKPYSSTNLIQIGIGGVLYPANSLHGLTIRKDLFMELAPMADDLWLNAMARLNGTRIVQSSKDMLTLPIIDESPSLSEVNNGANKNDLQLSQIREYLITHGLSDVYNSRYSI